MRLRTVCLGWLFFLQGCASVNPTAAPVVGAGSSGSAVPVSAPSVAAAPSGTVSKADSGTRAVSNSAANTAWLDIETLREEVMTLRGLLEEQGAAIERMQKDSRSRYLDLDRRVSELSVQPSAGRANQVAAGEKASPARAKKDGRADTAAASDAGDLLYTQALQLVRGRQFSQAIEGLQKYMARYPSGSFVDNAQYWLGEVYLARGDKKDLAAAEKAFLDLLEEYPSSGKRADATYKLGLVYDRQGREGRAVQKFNQVLKDFPGSSAARLAGVYLKSLPSSS